MLEPMKKSRLYEGIVKQITDMIRSGELKAGDRLPTERDLAVELNVSRTAIREALRSMELMGMIESKVGGGTFIRELTLDSLMDPLANILSQNDRLTIELIEVRMLLEVEITKLAAQRITEKKIQALEKSLQLMQKEIDAGELGLKGDNAFHLELAKAADNLAMMSITRLCGELLSNTRKAALEALDDRRIGVRHHQAIFEAVKAGQAKEAADLMRKHLEMAYQNLSGHQTSK